jgi:L-seryl-tRNA(Ser) seleniumtransferase
MTEIAQAPRRVVSAGGFVTTLGGSARSPAARAAMARAAGASWSIAELQEWAGTVIAQVTGAESGWVTCGAAAGLTLGVAACIAGTDVVRINALPASAGTPREIVTQRGHRNSYDRAFRLAGATITEVGYPYAEGIGRTYEYELSAACGDQTVAVAYCARATAKGLPLDTVCELAHAEGLPVIVDAAAELPPVDNLRRFIADGADLVVFSGGKAIRGPQASGVVAGKRGLIESIGLQTLDMDVDPVAWAQRHGHLPPHHGLGRSLKVGQEEILGVVAALQEFAHSDQDVFRREFAEWLEQVRETIDLGTVVANPDGSFYPRLVVPFGAEPRARAIAEYLESRDPRVFVAHAPLVRGEIVICPEAIDESDRDHVEASLASAVGRGDANRPFVVASRLNAQTSGDEEQDRP